MKKGFSRLYSTAKAMSWVGSLAGVTLCVASSIMGFFEEDHSTYVTLLFFVGVIFMTIGGLALNQAQFIRLVMDQTGTPSSEGPPSPPA